MGSEAEGALRTRFTLFGMYSEGLIKLCLFDNALSEHNYEHPVCNARLRTTNGWHAYRALSLWNNLLGVITDSLPAIISYLSSFLLMIYGFLLYR